MQQGEISLRELFKKTNLSNTIKKENITNKKNIMSSNFQNIISKIKTEKTIDSNILELFENQSNKCLSNFHNDYSNIKQNKKLDESINLKYNKNRNLKYTKNKKNIYTNHTKVNKSKLKYKKCLNVPNKEIIINSEDNNTRRKSIYKIKIDFNENNMSDEKNPKIEKLKFNSTPKLFFINKININFFCKNKESVKFFDKKTNKNVKKNFSNTKIEISGKNIGNKNHKINGNLINKVYYNCLNNPNFNNNNGNFNKRKGSHKLSYNKEDKNKESINDNNFKKILLNHKNNIDNSIKTEYEKSNLNNKINNKSKPEIINKRKLNMININTTNHHKIIKNKFNNNKNIFNKNNFLIKSINLKIKALYNNRIYLNKTTKSDKLDYTGSIKDYNLLKNNNSEFNKNEKNISKFYIENSKGSMTYRILNTESLFDSFSKRKEIKKKKNTNNLPNNIKKYGIFKKYNTSENNRIETTIN